MNHTIVVPNEVELKEAQKLVNYIFPDQGPMERLFFFAFKHRGNILVKFLLHILGFKDLDVFYIAKSEQGEVIGTIGLYSLYEDANEAFWLSWFVVAPQVRGQGVGKALLAFAEQETRRRQRQIVRLYTGSGEIMAKAQELYENAGYPIYRTKKYPGFSKFYRQKVVVPQYHMQMF